MIELYQLELDALSYSLQGKRELMQVIEALGESYKFTTTTHQWIYDELVAAFNKSGEVPTEPILLHRAGGEEKKKAIKKALAHRPASPKLSVKELSDVAMLGSIRDVADEVKKKVKANDPDGARELLTKFVLSVGRAKEATLINFYEDFPLRQAERKKLQSRTNISIKTMIKSLDEAFTGGGMLSGDLVVIVGVTSIGKTYFVSSQIGYMAVAQGWSGIHITLEDSAWSIANRYDARMFKIPKRRIAVHEFSAEELKFMDTVRKRHHEMEGKLQIVGMPAGACRVETVKRLINERKMAGYFVDFVIIDSPDHMPPIRKRDQYRLEVKDLFQALKDLAEEYRIPVIVTTHMPQKFEGKIATQRGVTAESYDKMRIATKGITLNQKDDMLKDEIMIVLVKNRDGESGAKISTIVDWNTGHYLELARDEDGDENRKEEESRKPGMVGKKMRS